MAQCKFGNIDKLKRNREIESESGTESGLPGGISLIALCASDANPAWRRGGEDFLAEQRARLLVMDWSGVVDQDGNAIPFSTDACMEFLIAANDAIPALQAVVYETQNFRGQRIEAIVDHAKY